MTITLLPPIQSNRGRVIKMKKMPVGVTMTELVQKEMNNPTGEIRSVASRLDINRDVFTLVRRLLILKEQADLNDEEREEVNKSLELINQGYLSKAQVQSYLVLKTHYKKNTRSLVSKKMMTLDRKKRTRFENTLFAIQESCCNNHELEVPILTTQERIDHIVVLAESIAGLSDLISKLKGEPK
jgi:hypothetical protein